MLAQKLEAITLLFISLTYSFWSNVICIPLFLFSNAYQLTKQIVADTFSFAYCFLAQLCEKFSLNRLVRYTLGCIKNFKSAVYRDLQNPGNGLLRQSRSQQQITATFMRAAASPDEITENEKVLMLMQKMRKLEETIFQESNDRRRAQTELFEVKSQLQEKNADLTKQRSQCVENMNKISVLKFQISEKNELLEKSTKHVAILQSQIKQMKQRIEKLLEEKRKESMKNIENLDEEKYQPHHQNIKIPQLIRQQEETD